MDNIQQLREAINRIQQAESQGFKAKLEPKREAPGAGKKEPLVEEAPGVGANPTIEDGNPQDFDPAEPGASHGTQRDRLYARVTYAPITYVTTTFITNKEPKEAMFFVGFHPFENIDLKPSLHYKIKDGIIIENPNGGQDLDFDSMPMDKFVAPGRGRPSKAPQASEFL
ncbi:hypothetical protein CAEBREN_04335 [Caenorhabditis brenneri]|uniref:Uncharacterized protein n=1 Tax=Caenorhabditis brenneri TaxID=135651 RepID=G0N824_CAEBE|nr:hypothetical protein CAEBREN_04335 [Caenorhabditis brenneri]